MACSIMEQEQEQLGNRLISAIQSLYILPNLGREQRQECLVKLFIAVRSVFDYEFKGQSINRTVVRFMQEKWTYGKFSMREYYDYVGELFDIVKIPTQGTISDRIILMNLTMYLLNQKKFAPFLRLFSLSQRGGPEYSTGAYWFSKSFKAHTKMLQDIEKDLRPAPLDADARYYFPISQEAQSVIDSVQKMFDDADFDTLHQFMVQMFYRIIRRISLSEFVTQLFLRLREHKTDVYNDFAFPQDYSLGNIRRIYESVSNPVISFGERLNKKLVLSAFCENTNGVYVLLSKLAGFFETDAQFIRLVHDQWCSGAEADPEDELGSLKVWDLALLSQLQRLFARKLNIQLKNNLLVNIGFVERAERLRISGLCDRNVKSASGYREINNLVYLQIKSYQLSHDEYYIFRLVQLLQVIFHNGMKVDKPICLKIFTHINNVSGVNPGEMFRDQPEDIQECMSLYLMLQLSLFSAMIRELSVCIGDEGKYKSLYDMKRAYIAQENNRDYLLFSAKKLESLLIFDRSMLDVDLFIRKRAKFLTELVFAQREQMKFVIPSQYWDDNQSQREEINSGL